MFIIWLEQLGQFWGSALDDLGWQLFEAGGWSTRSQIKLIDIDHSEFVIVDQIQGSLELFISLFCKPTNDVSSDCDSRTMFQKIVTNFCEILNRVLTIHFCQYVVVSSLHWDVDKGKYSGVVKKVGYSPEMLQHVRRVGHSDLKV